MIYFLDTDRADPEHSTSNRPKDWLSDRYEEESALPAGLRAGVIQAYAVRKKMQSSADTMNFTGSGFSNLVVLDSAGHCRISSSQQTLTSLSEQCGNQWKPLAWISSSLSHLPKFQIRTSTQTAAKAYKPRLRSTTEIIDDIKASTDIPNSDQISARLSQLAEVCREEAPEQSPIARDSLEDLEHFLRSIPCLKRPSLVVTMAGNVRAEWKGTVNRFLGLEFLGAGIVRTVIFAPDRKRYGQINRASIAAHVDSVLELLHPYGLSKWVIERNDIGI